MSLTWISRYVGGDSYWEAVCWSAEQNKFVAVAAQGTNTIMNSTDGVTWTEIPNATSGATHNGYYGGWRAVCWGKEANIFVAVGNSGSTRVMTSTNGINWTPRTAPSSDNQWFDVCWSPELTRFVAVAEWSTTNSNRVMTSSDGITWSPQATSSHNWVSVCWSPQLTRFVAVAYVFGNPTADRVMTSDDGFSWVLQLGKISGWTQVCWSPLRSLFVAVADQGTYRIMTSSDGFTWTGSTQATDANFRGVAWSQESQLFVGVCWGGTNRVWTSSDGFTWTGSTPFQNDWYDVCWSRELHMFAVTSRGGSTDKVITAFGTATVPSAPQTLTATAGNSQVILNWTIPSSNGGSTIIEYIVTRDPGNVTTPTGSTATSRTISGLNNGTSYTFSVKARNTIGTSGSSDSVSATPISPNPSAPTITSVTAGNAQVTVTWTAGSSNGSTISGYRIERSENQTTWTSAASANSGETSKLVTGLTNGSTYYFRVFTTSSNAGESPASSTSSAIRPNVTPGTPTGLNVTVGNASASLSWTAPTSNGGSAITSYNVISSPVGGTVSINFAARTATVINLTNGTAYTYSVTATNAGGTNISGTSAASGSVTVTPNVTPGTPTGLTVTVGNASASLSWTAPTSNGGTAITSYNVISNPLGGTIITNSVTRTATVSGLTNGTAYTYSVTATNAGGTNIVGTSAASGSVTVTPNVTPGTPTGLTVTVGNASASLSWTAPTSNGGTAITRYNVISDPSDGTIIINSVERTATVTNLTNGTPYTYRVTATNAGGTNISGTSSPSNEVQVTPFTVPSFPTNVRATSRNTQATVSWTAPNNGGSAITSYSVTSSPGNFQLTTADGLTTTVTFSGLTNGTAYSFTVLAINNAGPSNVSNPSAPIIPIGPPVTNKKIAISNDGKVVALSSSSYSDISKGRVYVYELSYNQTAYNWTPLGLSSEIIVGISNEDMFGWDIALSSDGRVVAGSSIYSDASGINCGQVRLFELSNNTNLWNQKGSAINGPLAGSESGYSISLSGNGNRIAIGAWKDSSNGSNAGAVRVYDFSAVINDWRQQGQTLTGNPESYDGFATALSLDGLTLASGCLNVDNANNVINAGQVKTFTWSGTSWNTKGIIQGADISYLYFGRALKLSGNGNSIVIGAPGNILRESEGTAWVYRYQSGTTWTQLGQTLLGISGGDDFGSSVAISNDGTIISVGSDNNSNNRGHVKVFAYANNYWNQVSNTLSGKSASSKAGLHALSGDGTTLIQSNNTYNSVYGINKTLTLNSPTTTISGNLLVLGNISVNLLDISDISRNHSFSTNGYSYKVFESDISNAVMKEYYSDVSSVRDLKVRILGNGDITNRNNSYSSLSDSRLKENILTSGPKLEDLLKVRIVNYKLKGSNNSTYIGVIAQELEGVFPNMVIELEPSPKDIQDGNTIKYKTVNYSSFDPILIKSLQEQNAMLKNIEERIVTLEEKFEHN